ncbi:polysaccharide biosynthesis C-terminal domain-containing protein [Devosia sp. ZB163]|uniref:oligosaccharide flippase family protein n=1 Tax=Devosia sp. ZB163 TaxID=3025938 RepID=UPI002360DF7F|nr:oligosaccharide flippase family protein [Devosia sp. ZB163]MDC9826306.1 polysaccharide biosynthesis C-terminal domain-containing protein [Devosia sp. ZB163]
MLLRSTLIYAPAILFTRLSALLLLVIATRLIDQTEYGLLALVVTVGELTDSAVTNWLRIALLRLGGKGEISRGSLALAARVLAVTTLVGLVVSAVASGLVVPERWAEFAAAVCVYLIVGAVSRFALTVLQMQQRHGAYSLLEFVRAALQLVLPVVAVMLAPHSFLVVSLASSAATLLAGLVGLRLALPRTVAGPARFTHGELFALGIPLIALAIVSFGLNSVERVLLKLYYDAGAVAVFAAAYALARQPIDTIANAINMGGFPEMVSRFDREGPAAAAAFLSHQMSLLARLSFPVAALLVALSTDIADLLLPHDYLGPVGQLFPLIAVAVMASNFSTFVFQNVIHAHKRPWLLLIVGAPGSIVTVVLSFLVIPHLAEVGAAVALAGGMLASLASAIVVSRMLTPIPVDWRGLATSVGIAVATGVSAYIASTLLGGAWSLFKLAAGGTTGGLVFLGLTALNYPDETRAFAGKVRARIGFA